jgi:steroid delta-isomerase-like uncharacterized protein
MAVASGNVASHRAGHEAFNRRDFEAMVTQYAESIVWRDRARGMTFRTPQEFKNVFLAAWVEASSDIQITDATYVDAGQTVVCNFTVVGKHDGSLGAFAATHREFVLPLCEMWHFDALGRVVGGDLYYDQLSLLTQLGLIPQLSRAQAPS